MMIERELPAEQLVELARGVEQVGADEVWVIEDLGWTGGISAAATALAVTSTVTVGIGIVPAPARSPAFLAMEIATLERLHPGRLIAGIGHGATEYMKQVGLSVPSPLTLLDETFTAGRGLLAGETVDLHGRAVTIDKLKLEHPPERVPPLVAGVKGPRSLELAGRVADGTILAEGSGLTQLADARRRVGEKAHRFTVFTHLAVGDDADEVEARIAPARALGAEFVGIPVDEATVASGTPEQAAAAVRALWEAGAATVAVRPVGDDPVGQLRRLHAAL